MKMISTTAAAPDEYERVLTGWQAPLVKSLRRTVRATQPSLEERIKWGHLVYLENGPVLLIRAEPARVLVGFWRGQRLREQEPRLQPGGKYEMATIVLREGDTLAAAALSTLVEAAVALNHALGDPTAVAKARKRST